MTLMILFLIILCGALAGAFLYQEWKGRYVSSVIFKGSASLCFVIAGLLCSPGTHTAKLIVYGLITGAAADVLLGLRRVFKEKWKMIFLAGILVFLTGHILYLAAVLPLFGSWLICVTAGIILTAFLMAWIFRHTNAESNFRKFGTVYVGTIMFLNCIAIRNLIVSPSAFTGLFAAGTVSFLISDILLILNTFGSEFNQSLRNTSTTLYYLGQLLIALSVGQLV